MNENELIEERKKKLVHFFKTRTDLLVYVLLAIVVAIATWIRIQPMRINAATGKPGLWDITTNNWTLGPDLDPFLFLRWAKYIAEHGTLFVIDTLRYVPTIYDTKKELLLLPYSVAWFHKIASIFGSTSVTQSAVIFPVVFFALTVISFFFLTREIFISQGSKQANWIGVIASFFLSIIPALLPRTIAGIPEKESMAFFFLFLAFYLFLRAWRTERLWRKYALAIGAGLATAAMALSWGGYIYIFVTLGLSLFIAFLFEQIDRKNILVPVIWLVSSLPIMSLFSDRYSLSALATFTVVLIAIFPITIYCMDWLLFKTRLKNYATKGFLRHVPHRVTSIVGLLIAAAIVLSIIAGPQFIISKVSDVITPLVSPVTDRLGVTVAENRQPYFAEWAGNFGPYLLKVPLFFWLFFFGSVYLFYRTIHAFSPRQKRFLTAAYFFFLISMAFSRYSETSLFNGTNLPSLLFNVAGLVLLLGLFGLAYYRSYKAGTMEKFTKINFGIILLFAFFFFSVVSARGSVRTIMILVPAAAIMVAYLIVSLMYAIQKGERRNVILIAITAVVILAAAYSAFHFYQDSHNLAVSYIPNSYTQQWQLAMEWIRENTPQTAVFAHWWDYGYWVQSIGERATVLDGGNTYPYWNHLISRHVLTSDSARDGLEFMYAHNVTNLLIDSTDIGKYPAFSSIGSDENYDRYSWIGTFLIDPNQVSSKKNITSYVYQGQFLLDEDIVYNLNGTQIFLPAGKAALLAVIVDRNDSGDIVSTPQGIFVYQNNQIRLPLKHVFEDSMHDFPEGVEATLFMVPRLGLSSQGATQFVKDGAFLYLSNRIQNTNFARLYLYGETDPHYTLAHTEDDVVVAQLKSQGISHGDFVVFDSVRGPIKIWSISYPADIELREEYLETQPPASVTA